MLSLLYRLMLFGGRCLLCSYADYEWGVRSTMLLRSLLWLYVRVAVTDMLLVRSWVANVSIIYIAIRSRCMYASYAALGL